MTSEPDIQLDVQVASTAPGLPDTDQLRDWVRAAWSGTGPDPQSAAIELTIRIVDEAESADLNGRYRDKPYPTNVLSFPADPPMDLPLDLLEDAPGELLDDTRGHFIGDLAICAPVVAREAVEQHKPGIAHWAHMVVHGVLHLCGYDHIDDQDAERMENLEIDILSTLGIGNPYISQLNSYHSDTDMEDGTQSHG